MPPINMRNSEKREKGTFKKSMGKLLRYCKKYWGWMVVALVLGAVSVVFQIIGPNKISEIANLITTGVATGEDVMAQVTKIAIFLVCIYVASALLEYIQRYITTVVTQKTVKKFRSDISHKINNLPLNYFDIHLHGDILSRVTNDVDTIGQSLNESVGSLVTSVIMLIGVLIMMFVTDWVLAFTVIGATLFGFVLAMIFMASSQKYFKNKRQKNLTKLTRVCLVLD